MKTVICLVLAGLLVASCKKEGLSPDPNLVGKWQWVVQRTSNPGIMDTPQSTGIEEMLIYNSDKTFSVVQNGTTVHTGTYKTAAVTNRLGEKVHSVTQHLDNVSQELTGYYVIRKDTLEFNSFETGSLCRCGRFYSRK